jgi:hypothetical protein
MKKSNLFSLFSSAALALALVSHASATTITIGGTSVAGQGEESSVAGAITTTFNGLTSLPSGFSSTGTTPANPLVNGSVSTVYLEPTGDTSTYLTTGTGFIIDTLAKDTNYFGFYWGSLDTYNTFQIDESNGSVLQINGAQLASEFNIAADGNSSYFVNFFSDPGTTFTSAGFTSGINSIEVDNVATATPEPGTIALLSGGLLVVAGALRRRKA